MARRVIVSTECPSCGAPLDFSEGSNAVQCRHCRSNLLVTGRRQVLSYTIAPRVDMVKAKAQAGLGLRRAKVAVTSLEPRLYFVPYYRITADDYAWVNPEPEPLQISPFDSGDDAARVLGFGPWANPGGISVLAGSFFDPYGADDTVRVHPVKKLSDSPLHLQFRRTKYHDDIEFADRRIEKNFVAADLGSTELSSIGVRSATLKLELFDRAHVERDAQLVKIDVDTDAAWTRARMLDRQRVVYRELVGERLSLLYFPWWIVRAGERLVLVDGVSGGVVSDNLPLSLYAALNSGGTLLGETVSFRPLMCPNCGWDFPARGDDAIFFCGSCQRSWLLEGKELRSLAHDIAAFPATKSKGRTQQKYLPFWLAEAGGRSSLIPAFRYRQLKHLQAFSTRLMKAPVPWERATELNGEAPGGCYDAEDAARLARFTFAALAAADGERIDQGLELNVAVRKLVWVPFRIQGNLLFDPFFGGNLFANLIG